MTRNDWEVAERVRSACLTAAREAYEDAGLSGLCAEGRWEAAVSAMTSLDLKSAIAASLEKGDERVNHS